MAASNQLRRNSRILHSLLLACVRVAVFSAAAGSPQGFIPGIGTAQAQDTYPKAAGGQPIAYSHRLHAGDLKIQCVYCHSSAPRSASAGMPAVGTCFGCHRLVKVKSEEMQKLDQFWEKKQPIVWNRLHFLEDHVYFSHKRHVRSGLACQGCHGEVEKMQRTSQVAPLTMGWCISCHEQRRAPLECSTCHD